jgi:hypothetical protein
VEAGKILGIEVLDHLIVNADAEYYSLKEKGNVKFEGEGSPSSLFFLVFLW